MNFGIPFKSPFGRPFGVPFLGVGGGGLPEPTGFVAKYTSYIVDNFGLVTGDNVSLWKDEANVTYGSEQVTNGDFSNGSTGWQSYSSGVLTATNGVAKVEATSNAMIRQNGAFNSIKNQLVKFRARCTQLENIAYNNGTSIRQTTLTFNEINAWQDFELFIDNMTNTNLIIGVYSGLSVGDYIEFDNISAKEILTGTNDLTQATSANQPVLVEQDVVKQATLANQPKVDYDKILTQDNVSNQPTLVDTGGGVTALEFDANDYLIGLNPKTSGNFAYRMKLNLTPSTVGTMFSESFGGNGSRILANGVGNSIQLVSSEGGVFTFNNYTQSGQMADILINLTSNSLEVYVDGVSIDGSQDFTGNTISIDLISRDISQWLSGNVALVEFYEAPISDPTNITENPDFTLDASNLATMRKADLTPASIGDQVAGWWDASAEKAMVFEEVSYMRNLVPSNDWTHYFKLNMFNDTQFLSHSNLPTRLKIFENGSFRLTSDSGLTLNITDAEAFNANSLKVSKNGGFITILIDDQEINGSPFDFTGEIFSFDTLSDDSLNTNFHVYLYKQWNSADSSGDPDFTLDASDQSSMRTSANEIAQNGDSVAKWYAQEHNPYQNTVDFGVDDFMSTLPSLTATWSYVLDCRLKTLGTTKYLLQETGGNSAILALSDNYLYLRDTTGANDIALTSHTLTDERSQYAFVKNGNDLLYYVNGTLSETVDVTGRTFAFGDVGASVDSSDTAFTKIIPFADKALTADEVAWYSYLRDENGNILLPPLLPS